MFTCNFIIIIFTKSIYIKRDLDLKKPIYSQTSSYGHFGRDEFSWEQPKKLVF
jgi:S-adenosylmethionine synthetase